MKLVKGQYHRRSCFLESHDFESALRLAVSIGGDSDTLAAITGGIAEAYYGIPKEIEQKALAYLPEEFQQVIWEFRELFCP
ncbi:ADP-ribosylglycohydrolase family protein [Fusobacterium nucleatum]